MRCMKIAHRFGLPDGAVSGVGVGICCEEYFLRSLPQALMNCICEVDADRKAGRDQIPIALRKPRTVPVGLRSTVTIK
jgi:hypothetical protein